MWYGFRKTLGLGVLLFLLLGLSAPLVTSAAAGGFQDKACCAHDSGDHGRDVADKGHDCPFCSLLSFDLTAPLAIGIFLAESRTLTIPPLSLVLAQYPRGIDWPPERA